MTVSYYAIPGLAPRTAIVPSDVIRVLCQVSGLTADQLKSKDRYAEIARARQLGMVIMYNECGISWARVGAHFGKDHSTCLHANKVVLLELKRNPVWLRMWEDIHTLLGLAGNDRLLIYLQQRFTVTYDPMASSYYVIEDGRNVARGTKDACHQFILKQLKIQGYGQEVL
jgi:hypothetical protein